MAADNHPSCRRATNRLTVFIDDGIVVVKVEKWS